MIIYIKIKRLKHQTDKIVNLKLLSIQTENDMCKLHTIEQ